MRVALVSRSIGRRGEGQTQLTVSHRGQEHVWGLLKRTCCISSLSMRMVVISPGAYLD